MKKIFNYLLLCIMMVMLSACGGNGNADNSIEKGIYDDNSQIAQSGDIFDISEYGSDEGDSGKKLILGGFNGVKNIYELTAKEDGTINISFDLTTSSGKFKCVFVNANNEVEVIVENSGSGDTSLNVPKGKGSIKIVGEEGSAELTTNVQNSDGNVEVEFIN